MPSVIALITGPRVAVALLVVAGGYVVTVNAEHGKRRHGYGIERSVGYREDRVREADVSDWSR